MAESVLARFLDLENQRVGAAGLMVGSSAMDPEGQPSILWGQGTPDGNLAPFNLVNKGSIYMSVDQADDVTSLYMKVDEGGESGGADWARIFAENQALIDTNDLAAAAGVTVEQLETNALSNIVVLPNTVDISAADSETVEFHAVAALTITEIGILWTEATGASGAAEGDITVGISTGNADVVAATSYIVSKAVGDYDALTISDGAMAAGESLFVSHDQASGAVGTYLVILKYDLDS